MTMRNSKLMACCFALRSNGFFRCVSCLGEGNSVSCHLLPSTVIVRLLPQAQPSVCLQGRIDPHQSCAADESVRGCVAGVLSVPASGLHVGRMCTGTA